MNAYDLAVVGGGPGGLATAMYAAMRGMSVVALEAEAFGGQLINLYPSKPVTNFPAQAHVLSRDLALRLAEQAAGFGAELREWEPVDHARAHGDGFVLRSSGRDLSAATLVLALGLGRFTPRRLGLDGEDRLLGKGLAYRLPPLEQIEARHAVVVGGGDSAFDTALSLQQVADVTLVHRSDEFRAYAHSQQRVTEAGLEVVTGGEIVELLGGDHLEGVVVSFADDRTLELPTDLLVVTIGQVPDMSGVASWELGLDGPHIEVDSAMQTARRGLLAVGDFASYPGKVRMIATAAAEGSTAAASAERLLLSGN
jgi:ferredoxin/flavodoxin---NADP+ reductase